MQITSCDATAGVRSVELFSAQVPTGEKGILGGDKTQLVTASPYETIVCGSCGYCEMYASQNALERLARIAEKTDEVKVITNEAATTQPFR